MIGSELFDTRVHLIVGQTHLQRFGVHGIVDIANNGATVLQLRDKTSSANDLFNTAVELKEACDKRNLPLLINDFVDIAMMVGANGVHVGQQDMSIDAIRRILKEDAVIGLSVKKEEEFQHAPLLDIDYISIGGVFATMSKNNPDPPIGLDGLRHLAAGVKKDFEGPVIAIAGVTLENAAQVIDCGTDGVAVISTIWNADKPEETLACLREIVDTQLNKRCES